MKLKKCSQLTRRPLTGFWFRALNLKHWKTRTSSVQATVNPSRFSGANQVHPGHRIGYFGENQQVAMYEVRALFGPPSMPVANPRISWLLMSFEVVLRNIVDLTDPAQQKLIGTTESELTGRWNNYLPSLSPTQELGHALYAMNDVEGFIYPSSLLPATKCLAIFPDRLQPNTHLVRFHNEISGKFEELQ